MAHPVVPGLPHHATQRGIGRPLGDEGFIASLESETGRLLKPGKRGPEPAKARAPKAIYLVRVQP